MGADMYLQIEGIKGDSTDSAHKDWIEVESFGHKIHQPSGAVASGRGGHSGGKAEHGDFSISKRLDLSTPLLAQYVCTGKAIPKMKLELCRALGDKATYMVYTLENAMVTTVEPQGSRDPEDPLPFERVDFRYGIIRWEYTPTDPSGKKGAAVKAAWDAQQNKTV